jgi:hypothetical protein
MEKENMTNKEIRAEVFRQINDIIDNANCTNFKILGYKYLNVRLVLYFTDCKQVYEWFYQEITPSIKFFTKDYEDNQYNENSIKFKNDMESEDLEKEN